MTLAIQPPCRGFNGPKPCDKHALAGSQYCAEHSRPPEEQRSKFAEEYRHLYNNARWRRLRKIILARDPICVVCERSPATVADHKKDHKGDISLFYDPENLRGVCKECHDKKTGRTQGFGSGDRKPHKPTCLSLKGAGFCDCGAGYNLKAET